MIANLHFIKQIGRDTKEALEAGNLERFGELMNIALGAQAAAFLAR